MLEPTQWTLPGADSELIHGDCHVPVGDPRGVIVLVHGFKGYKDYGMFPVIAHHLCNAGFIVHRPNLSHSGMREGTESFERPDLFESDTWNKHRLTSKNDTHQRIKGTLTFNAELLIRLITIN